MADGDQVLTTQTHQPRMSQSASGWPKFLLIYLCLATPMHFVWEILHVRLYTISKAGLPGEVAFAIAHCTAGDALIAALAMGAALWLSRWFEPDGWPLIGTVALAAALGAGYTISSEWLNVEVRRTWAYTEDMPRVPPLGTGLTPLLQWLLITPLAALAAHRVVPLGNRNGPAVRGTGTGGGPHGTALIAGGIAVLVATMAPIAAGTSRALAETAPAPLAVPLPEPVERLAILSEMRPKDRSTWLPLLIREAESRGLPSAIADAVAFVESGYDPSATGAVGEIGMMQVRPTTATMLGHRGGLAELFLPETNIRLGVTYLAQAWRLTGGDLCRTLMKYRAGHGEERMTARSVEYCRRARDRLAALGSPLANVVIPATGIASRATPASKASAASPGSGRENLARVDPLQAWRAQEARRLWAEHVARVQKIEAKLQRVMSGS